MRTDASLLDQPGQRRSHQRADTARRRNRHRVAVVCRCWPGRFARNRIRWHVGFAWPSVLQPIALVALVGWIDDHRGLARSAGALLVHCIAAFMLGLPALHVLLRDPGCESGAGPDHRGASLCRGFAHGLVDQSAQFHGWHQRVACRAGAVRVRRSGAGLCRRGSTRRGADNRPVRCRHARISCRSIFRAPRMFMGDVGSGVLGLLVAVAVVGRWPRCPRLWPAD